MKNLNTVKLIDTASYVQ